MKLYVIIDFISKTKWAVFDEEHKEKIIEGFRRAKTDSLHVCTIIDNIEVDRKTFDEFIK